MAILQKRKAVNQLPGAREFADRSNRQSLTSVDRTANDLAAPRNITSKTSVSPNIRPTSSGNALPSLTSSTTPAAKPVTSTLKNTSPTKATSTTAKPSSVMTGKAATGTSTSKPTTTTTKPATSTTKPVVSTKPTTPVTKPTTSVVKPAVSKTDTTTPTTKTTTTPTTTKLPVITTKPTKTTGNVLTNALTGAALGAGAKAVIDKLTGKPAGIPSSNASNGTGLKPGSPTSGVKPSSNPLGKNIGNLIPKGGAPVTSKVLTDEEIKAELDKAKASEEPWTPPEGATQNPDGTWSVANDGMVTTYGSDGSVLGAESDGSTLTPKDGTTVVAGTDGTENVDLGGGYYQNAAGDIYTSDGVLYATAGSDGEYYLAGGDSTTSGGDVDLGGGYIQKADGNIYTSDGTLYATMGSDGEYSLSGGDTSVANNTWTDDTTGDVWNMGSDGNWSLASSGSDGSDPYGLGSDGSDGSGSYSLDGTYIPPRFTNIALAGDGSGDGGGGGDGGSGGGFDGGSGDFGANGGLITMMKNGGLPHFISGGAAATPTYSNTDEEVQDWQNVGYNYGEPDDPTMTGDLSLYSQSGGYKPTYLSSPRQISTNIPEGQGTGLDFMPEGWPDGYRDNYDGTATEIRDDGSTVTIDADNNIVYTTDPEGNVVQNNQLTNQPVVQSTSTRPTNNPVVPSRPSLTTNDANKPITSVGGLGGTKITPNDTSLTPEEIQAEKDRLGNEQSTWNTIKNLVGGSGYLGAGAAGGILGALLGNSDLLTGGSSGQNQQALDMSTVGALNPRTTDFGIGPARYVGYDEYGAQDQMPDLYGTELGKNLNAPGFNPVNEGDYGYDTTDVDQENVEGLAEGGQPQDSPSNSASTYFTFGKPVDPMQNLYSPQPMQQPQQPMGGLNASGMAPQGMTPQGMQPQGMAPQGMTPPGMSSAGMDTQGMMPNTMKPQGLRSGGLPAWSQVPMTNGRLNFRDGAPVHGPGDGQSDDIPAMLADGEYVIDAETVAQIGNGSTKAGAQALDKFREGIRAHKRSAPINKIPPKTKALTSYLKGAK